MRSFPVLSSFILLGFFVTLPGMVWAAGGAEETLTAGMSCYQAGTTRASADSANILACMKVGEDDSRLVWKSMTPVFVTQDGNVGIGTSTPLVKLDVAGSLRVSDSLYVGGVSQVASDQSSYGTPLFFSGGASYGRWNSDNSDPLWIARYNQESDVTEMRVNIGDNGESTGSFDKFVVGHTSHVDGFWYPKFTVKSNGNVGIGTTEPQVKLDVVGNFRIQGQDLYEVFFNDAYGSPFNTAHILMRSARGTMAAPGTTGAGDVLGIIRFLGFGSSAFQSPHAGTQVMAIAEEGFTNSSGASRLAFRTVPSGAIESLERMTIKSDGNVGIGTTEPYATLDVNGYAKLKANATAPVACSVNYRGSIAYTGGTTNYLCFCNGISWVQAHNPTTACTW